MADLADKSGSVYSNIVNNNDDSVTATIPNTPVLNVESVVATVDNTAAASAATLTLTIQDQDGQVIAQKAMPGTIPAGDTGVGTFALGLDDPSSSGGIVFDTPNVGGTLRVETTGTTGGDGMRFIADLGQIRFFADDLVAGAFRVDAPFIRFDTNGASLRLLDSGETFFACDAGASWSFGDFDLSSDHNVGLTATDNAAIAADTFNLDTDGNAALGIGGNYEENVTGTFANITNGSYSVNANDVSLTAAVGGVVFGLASAATSLIVSDHLGNPIFRIDENGDLHGKTGKALVFDL